MQNLDKWDTYADAIDRGALPLSRAYRPTDDERLVRELVLQLKLGSVRPAYFREKYHVDILDRFRESLDSLDTDGYLATANAERVSLTRDGLLHAVILPPRFFHPEHRSIRYT
jgi:oxygen-independent coproporphyrinogen-3 oxidase